MLLAKRLDRMRGKIDDDETPAGPQHAAAWATMAAGLFGKMQDMMDGDGVEGLARQGRSYISPGGHGSCASPPRPAWSRAIASMAEELSIPTPRPILGPSRVRTRPVPVPISSRSPWAPPQHLDQHALDLALVDIERAAARPSSWHCRGNNRAAMLARRARMMARRRRSPSSRGSCSGSRAKRA